MDDPDATIPVPKPVPQQEGVTPSQVGNLFAAGAGAFDTRPASSGARGWEPPSVEILQQALPQYEITHLVARGGMGAVYKGMQRALKRPVAIKVLPPEMNDAGGSDLQFAARFKQEAQAMARLSHPNIVAVFDAGEVVLGDGRAPGPPSAAGDGSRRTEDSPPYPNDGGLGTSRPTLLYFVMEFIEGTDVAQLIASEGRLTAERAAPIIAAVCEALAFAHEEGIVHRDIKPSNIMIDKKGRVKVADFGLAKTVNLESTLMTRSDVAMGTPDFVAPEALIPGMQVDGRADLYAVGVMLYQMLTGKIPRGRFELPSGVIPQVDKAFDAIVDRAMQTDRDKRYSTATEMKRDVESVVMAREGSAGVPFGAAQPARSHPTGGSAAKKEAPKSGRAPLLIAAAVVVLGGGAFFLLREDSEGRADGPPSAAKGPEAANTPPAALGGPSALPGTFPTGQWTKVFTTFEELRTAAPEQLAFAWKDGWIDGTASPTGPHATVPGSKARNGGIRLHGKIAEGVTGPFAASVSVRRKDGKGGQSYQLTLRGMDAKASAAISYYDDATKKGNELRYIPADPTAKPGDEFDMELIAIGDKLYGKFNGKALPVITDARLTEGELSFQTRHLARDIEVIHLDGLSEAEALKAAGIDGVSSSQTLSVSKSPAPESPNYPQPKAWTDVTADIRKRHLGKALRPLNDGWMEATEEIFGGELPKEDAGRPDVAVRIHFANWVQVHLRKQPTALDTFYQVGIRDRKTEITLVTGKRFKALAPAVELPQGFDDGSEHELTAAVVGDRISLWLDGKLMATARDGTLDGAGGKVIHHYRAALFNGTPTRLRQVEYAALGAEAPVSASPSLPVSKTSTTSAAPAKPGPWIDATEKLRRSGQEKGLFTTEGEWLVATRRSPEYFPLSGSQELADVAVRVVFRNRVQVKLRRQPSAQKFGGYIVGVGNDRRGIGFSGDHPDREWVQPEIGPGKSDEPDAEHELVFAAHGNQLMYWIDGRLMARIKDDRYQKGHLELGTLMDGTSDPKPTSIKKVEYMSLDGLSEAEALKAAGVAGRADGPPSAANGPSATGTPQTALGGPRALPAPLPQPGPDGRMVFPAGVWTQMKDLTKHEKTEDGPWIRLGQVVNGWYEKDVVLMTNLGIRARFRGQRVKDYDYPQLNLRGVKDKTPALNLHIRSGKMQIRVMETGFPVLAEAPLREPLPAGKEYVAELYTIGQQVIARVNGQVLTATTDVPPAPGSFSLFGADWDYFQDAQVLNLDGLSESEARKAAGIGE